jgi:hypothetical protein
MGLGGGLDLAGLKRDGLNVDGSAGLEALSCQQLDTDVGRAGLRGVGIDGLGEEFLGGCSFCEGLRDGGESEKPLQSLVGPLVKGFSLSLFSGGPEGSYGGSRIRCILVATGKSICHPCGSGPAFVGRSFVNGSFCDVELLGDVACEGSCFDEGADDKPVVVAHLFVRAASHENGLERHRLGAWITFRDGVGHDSPYTQFAKLASTDTDPF